MEFGRLDHYTANGWDETRFMISTNPGEPLKPLDAVASGGELSRIMLALKTVLAENDEIETLIFDEIDSGISGRTAQMVAEKIKLTGKNHQIICITHLPQIAAMADHHFLIEKNFQCRCYHFQYPKSGPRGKYSGTCPNAWRREDYGCGVDQCERDERNGRCGKIIPV